MNIIVCTDTRTRDIHEALEGAISSGHSLTEDERFRIREDVNLDGELCRRLRKRKHEVWLLDGYEDDLIHQIRDPSRVALRVAQLIADKEVLGMVLDLDFFGIRDFGINVLRSLFGSSSVPHGMKIAVYSRFITDPQYDFVAILRSEFHISREWIFDRNQDNIEIVANVFDP